MVYNENDDARREASTPQKAYTISDNLYAVYLTLNLQEIRILTTCQSVTDSLVPRLISICAWQPGYEANR